jgi:hypothetical protein
LHKQNAENNDATLFFLAEFQYNSAPVANI